MWKKKIDSGFIIMIIDKLRVGAMKSQLYPDSIIIL